MNDKKYKLIGILFTAIAVIISLLRFMPAYEGFLEWLEFEQEEYQRAVFLLGFMMGAWVLATISLLITMVSKKYLGTGVLLAGIIFLGVYIYCSVSGIESPDQNVYSFLFLNIGEQTIPLPSLPIEGILYLLGGICLIIAQSKSLSF